MKEDDSQKKKRQAYIKQNVRSDMTLTTEEKSSFLTPEQRQIKINRMEREYERDLLRYKRQDR